jgi:MtfA peptidase
MGYIIFALLTAGVVLLFYRWATRKERYRQQLIKKPFPVEWRHILENRIGFYHSLSPENKVRFENKVQVFLAENNIIGLKTTVDDNTRILVAASAIIPIFGFDEWEYFNLGEILITDGALSVQEIDEKNTNLVLGEVRPFQNHHYMTLSKSALEEGFKNMEDKKNVGIHEFAHLLDQADGVIDGVPKAYLPKELIEPWSRMIHKEMEKIRSGDSLLQEYGAVSEAEFFAVATECFFEDPAKLSEKHPQLYKLLSKTFRQNPKRRFDLDFKELLGHYSDKLGRNDPCPCGSGEKYKNCCLT